VIPAPKTTAVAILRLLVGNAARGGADDRRRCTKAVVLVGSREDALSITTGKRLRLDRTCSTSLKIVGLLREKGELLAAVASSGKVLP
jgi:hypothetical protein